MVASFVIWGMKSIPNVCCLLGLTSVPRVYELRKGMPRAASFPADASFSMDPDFPHDTLLADNLINIDMLIVISSRLKEFLEARKLQKVEYLPVTILDHKKKPVKCQYYILHPIEPVECLDIEQCGTRWSKIDKETIQGLDSLVFNESKLDREREVFRPKSFYRITLVKRELATEMDSKGFTGIRWVETSNYPED